MSQIPTLPAPMPTRDTAPFWEAAKQEQLLIQQCEVCENWQFYPRGFCSKCLSGQLRWVRAGGQGTIHTFTVCHVPGHPAMAQRVPYIMAFVDLTEGVRILAEIQGVGTDTVVIGDKVVVIFEHRPDGWTLPQFRLCISKNMGVPTDTSERTS